MSSADKNEIRAAMRVRRKVVTPEARAAVLVGGGFAFAGTLVVALLYNRRRRMQREAQEQEKLCRRMAERLKDVKFSTQEVSSGLEGVILGVSVRCQCRRAAALLI